MNRNVPVGAWIGPLIFPGLLLWFAAVYAATTWVLP